MNYDYLLSCVAVLTVLNICLRYGSFILPARVIEHPVTRELAKYLPAVVMSLLVLMCMKDLSSDTTHLIAGLAGLATVAGLHIFRRNALLSIVCGTVVYMLMIN